MFLCLIVFLHDIVLDIAVGAFISSSSMDCSEIALSITCKNLSIFIFNPIHSLEELCTPLLFMKQVGERRALELSQLKDWVEKRAV